MWWLWVNFFSLVPLVDFLGKVEEDSMGKVLSMCCNEFLQPLVALLFILLVQCRHLQGVVQCFDFFHAGIVMATVTHLKVNQRSGLESDVSYNFKQVRGWKCTANIPCMAPFIVHQLISLLCRAWRVLNLFSPLALLFVQEPWLPALSPPASCICYPGCLSQSFQSQQDLRSNPSSHPESERRVQRREAHLTLSRRQTVDTCIWKNSPISSKMCLALLCSFSLLIPACKT